MRNQKGADAERELRRILEDRGEYVIRSAASKRIDLISIPAVGGPYAIEVKSTSKDTWYVRQNVETMLQLTEHLLLADRMPVWYYIRFSIDNRVVWRKWAVKDPFPMVLRWDEGESI